MYKRKLTDYFSPSPPPKKQNILGNVKVDKPVEKARILDIQLGKNEYKASPKVKLEPISPNKLGSPNIKDEKKQEVVKKTVSPMKKQNIVGILTQRDLNVKVEKPVEKTCILDIKLEKDEYKASPKVKLEPISPKKLGSPNIKGEKKQKVVKKTVSPKKKAPSTPVSRVLKSLGRDAAEAGDSVKPLLSGSFKKNCQEVAAFALFLKERQDILVARTMEPCLAPPFTDNKTLSTFFFTNINREADTGTKYFRHQMFSQHPVISLDQLPEILWQIVLYRSVNKKDTFEQFGGIPRVEQWDEFSRFMFKWMVTDDRKAFFTSAHINQGRVKTEDMVEFVRNKREVLAKKIRRSQCLEDVFQTLRTIKHIGDFLAWQMTADLMELKLVHYNENTFTFLGPGARAGLQKVLGPSALRDQLQSTKQLTRLLPGVLAALNVQYKHFLGRQLTLKATEHALCEFDKYWRAVQEDRSKRQYTVARRRVGEPACSLCEAAPWCLVSGLWPLCSRCAELEEDTRPRVTEVLDTGAGEAVKLASLRVKVENKTCASD